MWNLRNKTRSQRRRGNKKTRQNQREINHKRLLITRNKLRVARGEGARACLLYTSDAADDVSWV